MNTVKSALKVLFLFALLLALGQGQTAIAQGDSVLITYQGRLTDADEYSIQGLTYLTFRIFGEHGVETLWVETHEDVQVDDGLFTVILGSQMALPYSIFTGEQRYLGITVEDDPEMTPRALLTSAPGAAVSRRVVGDIRTDVGELVVTNPVVNPGQVKVKVVDDAAGADIFGNIDSFEMAGNLYITADPDEAGLLATHGSHDDPFGVELIARAGMNVVQIHPPDPCVPSDSCEPALEMVAEPENHIFRVHPPEPCVPPEPCGPAFEVAATDSSTTVAVKPPSGDATEPAAVETYLKVKEFSVENEIKVNVFGEEPVEVMSIGTSLDDGSTHLLLKAPEGGATIEVNADPVDAKLTLLNGDPAGPADIVLRALPDGGGQIGINTDTPEEALDVDGTVQTTGFKMPTGAADGRVLTSDGEGNGTWQAPGSAGYKKACADMYEGMTNLSSQVTITFPVTFSAAPHFSVTGLIKSGTQAGQMAHIPKPTPGTSSVTVTIQYWDGGAFDNVGNSVEVMLSYTAIEK